MVEKRTEFIKRQLTNAFTAVNQRSKGSIFQISEEICEACNEEGTCVELAYTNKTSGKDFHVTFCIQCLRHCYFPTLFFSRKKERSRSYSKRPDCVERGHCQACRMKAYIRFFPVETVSVYRLTIPNLFNFSGTTKGIEGYGLCCKCEKDLVYTGEKVVEFHYRSTYYDEQWPCTCSKCKGLCKGIHYTSNDEEWKGTFCKACLPPNAHVVSDSLSNYTGD